MGLLVNQLNILLLLLLLLLLSYTLSYIVLKKLFTTLPHYENGILIF